MRILLALPALALMLCAAPFAEATLVSSDFRNANLSVSTLPTSYGSGLNSFSVISSPGNNTVPTGDSITFTAQTGSNRDRYIRGTSTPNSFPHTGYVSVNRGGSFFSPPVSTTHTLTFNVSEPISEITLRVAGLVGSRALVFSGDTASGISGVTEFLTLSGSGATVGASPTANSGNSLGNIVWTFDTPLTNPTIQFSFNSNYNTQVHFASISYTTVAAIPEPISFVWFASAFGLVQYGRRRRTEADLAD